MSPAIRDPGQGDLLSWDAPKVVVRFDHRRVRAASLGGKIKRAIAEALREQTEKGFDREAIAVAMADFLTEPMPKSQLDAWCSEAREEHLPNVARFMALVHATWDIRLLQVLAEPCGWAVVDKKWLPLIELASLREHEDTVKKRRQALQAHARISGTLG